MAKKSFEQFVQDVASVTDWFSDQIAKDPEVLRIYRLKEVSYGDRVGSAASHCERRKKRIMEGKDGGAGD
jgi:hypothetical protein